MKEKVKKILICFIAIITLMCIIPIKTMATECESIKIKNRLGLGNTDSSPDYFREIVEKSQLYDEFEVVSLREENVKHFVLSDGTFKAEVYSFPVHIMSDKGNWVECGKDDKNYKKILSKSNDNLNEQNALLSASTTNPVTCTYDTYISSNSPAINYNFSEELWVGTNQITYIRFNLPYLPDNAYINNATLSVYYHYFSNVTTGYLAAGVYRVKDYWASSSLTWNNAGQDKKLYPYEYDRKDMPAYGSQRTLCNFNITEMAGEWYAGVINYGVGIKWSGGTNSSVLIDSREYGTIYAPKITIQYTLDGAPIKDGIYMIKNVHKPLSGKFIQIDDGDAPNNYQSNHATTELWRITGNDEQLWHVECLHRYYKITSVKSGKSISIKPGFENTNESNIVQETYSQGNLRQMWDICDSYSGEKYIKPRSAKSTGNDWCISAAYGTIYNDGWGVKQRICTFDGENRDEWMFIELGKDAFLFGLDDDSCDRRTILGRVMKSVQNAGCDSIRAIGTNNLPLNVATSYLEDAKIFLYRGHGWSNSDETMVWLNESATAGIRSSTIYNFTNNTAVLDLSNANVFLFVACQTANHPTNSLPKAAVNAGAKAAVGFTGNIWGPTANDWSEYFLDYYASGYSVSLAAYRAAQNCLNLFNISTYVVEP